MGYRDNRPNVLFVTAAGLLIAVLALPAYCQGGSESTAASPQAPLLAVCSGIYEGDFVKAKQILAQIDPNGPQAPYYQRLTDLLDRYDAISNARDAARTKVYEDHMARLERLKTGKGPSQEPNEPSTDDQDEPNSLPGPVGFNDPNGTGITSVLATVAAMVQYADPQQNKALLADQFVRKAMQRGMDLAAKLEQQGKWLEAYVNYAAYLKAIDPNNIGLKDYAEDLLEKAGIAASFEDSPCKTSKERFQGVKARIFTRAIRILGTRYVNSMDYTQMASDGLKRCRQLAEVLAKLDPNRAPYIGSIDGQRLDQWRSGLARLTEGIRQSATGLDERSFLRSFEELLELNQSTIGIPEDVLIWHFAQAALEALDPHTMIVWPREKAEFDSMLTNEFSGIGVEISKPEGVLTISSLLLDTPAYRAGLDAGDVIEAVDGIPTKDISLDCAKEKIRGPRGTKVTLTIKRPGEEGTREVDIVRDRILVPSIYGWQRTEDGQWRYLIDPNDRIAYIRLNSFAKDTSQQLERILRNLEREGLNGLILDLRWNEGGLLDVAVKIVDMFVREGVILRVRPGLYGGLSESVQATNDRVDADYPLVILVNSTSASASEIVAGVLSDQKYERAIVVGERTHGKGSVQSIEDRGLDGAELKYTTAYYYLPSNQRVNSRQATEKLGRKDWGIGPDVEVVLRPDEVRQLLSAQRANDILVQAERPATKEAPKRRSAQEIIEADPQLAIGLLVLKARMVEASLASS